MFKVLSSSIQLQLAQLSHTTCYMAYVKFSWTFAICFFLETIICEYAFIIFFLNFAANKCFKRLLVPSGWIFSLVGNIKLHFCEVESELC